MANMLNVAIGFRKVRLHDKRGETELAFDSQEAKCLLHAVLPASLSAEINKMSVCEFSEILCLGPSMESVS